VPDLIAPHSRTVDRGASPTTRRAFVGEAVAGLLCVFANITKTLTRSVASRSQQGKPALTVRSVNQYIDAARREDESTQLLLAAEVKRDVLAFLDQRFALSTAQQHGLSVLTQEDRRRITIAIESALRPGWRLVFRSSQPNEADGTSMMRPDKTTVAVTLSDSSSHHGQPNGTVVLSWPCPPSQ